MSEVTLSVSEVSEFVAELVRQAVPEPIWVEGEIANITRSAKGHVYFTLIEPGQRRSGADHSLSVTLLSWFRDKVNLQLRRSGGNVRMSDGVRVRVRGNLEVYTARSQVQLKMIAIDPVFTLGTLAADRAALVAALRSEGLLELNRSRVVPPIPQRIALVTSLGSAAHADFTHEMERVRGVADVIEFDSRVQGSDAAESIVAALLAADEAGVDIIALVRGGGAKTDLAAFDEPDVARTIATRPTPVWTGLGHETDDSVADLVAHTRHKTPTACAAEIVAAISRGVLGLESLWSTVVGLTDRLVDAEGTRLNRLARLATIVPRRVIDRSQHQLTHTEQVVPALAERSLRNADIELRHAEATLQHRPRQAITAAERRIDSFESILRAYDPAHALSRGWSITRTPDGRIASAAALTTGDRLITELADGVVTSTVEGTSPPP